MRDMGRVLTIGIVLSSGVAQALEKPGAVLVMEGATDLEHRDLVPFHNQNLAEFNGSAGVDDNDDSFTDNILGWNFVSDNAIYFPDKIRNLFTQNEARVDEVLSLYTQIEEGVEAAAQRLRSDPALEADLNMILDLSHATHVAGIVAKNSLGAAKMQSLNIFEGSENEPEQAIRSPFRSHSGRMSYGHRGNHLGTSPSNAVNTASAFDDSAGITQFVNAEGLRLKNMSERVAEYIKSSGAGVVNVSLGWTEIALAEHFNDIWLNELAEKGLTLSTRRSPSQEANFLRLVNGNFSAWKKYWETVVSANPDVLFVVAAGNAGLIPELANNDLIDEVPGNFSTRFNNVITIAATDAQGVISNFSSTGARTVNLAAIGQAVPSLAPDNNQVTMSGTSMAAPAVAGVASQMRTLNPRLKASDVRQILERSGQEHPSLVAKVSSNRLLDAQAAEVAARSAEPLNIAPGLRFASVGRNLLRATPQRSSLFLNSLTPPAGNSQVQSSEVPAAVLEIMQKRRAYAGSLL